MGYSELKLGKSWANQDKYGHRTVGDTHLMTTQITIISNGDKYNERGNRDE